jgi:VWFA-related protein
MVASYSLGGVRVLLPFSASSEEWSLALESTLGGASRMPARELEEQQMMADIGEALKEARQDRSMASSLLQGLLGRAQHYATSVNHDSKAVIEALHSFSGALAALPGRKSLLYVGNGFAMRPGEDVFGLLSAVFENDRRFGDSSVVAAGGSNRGAADAPQGEAGRQGQSGAGAVVSFPSRAASPLLQHGTTGLDLTGEVDALSAAANGERVTFYAINSTQTGGLGARADTGRGARIAASPTSNDSPSGLSIFENSRLELLQESLDYVSNTTGGLASAPGANVGAFLDRMWAQSSSYYSLAYPLPHPEETGVRRIKVKVNRKGVRLRHREAYVVKPRTARIGDLMTGALLLHTGENPHRLDAGLAGQEAGADGTYSVSLGLRIPIDELALLPAGDALRTELEVYVLSMDQRGRLSELRFAPLAFTIAAEEARDRPFVATFPLVLEPGSHAVAVGLAERRANRFSVARTTLEIGGTD